MITLKINVTKIDKSALFTGKNGKYLDLVLHDNRDGQDQYGNDGFVTQDIGKERREAGERGPIIGNWKETRKDGGRTETRREQARAETSDRIPDGPAVGADDDDIPFAPFEKYSPLPL